MRNKNNENKLEGIWIPLDILQLEDLSISEKVVLAVIKALDNENGCFASNEYIANVIGVKARRISAAVSSLKKKGYIRVEIFNFNSRTITCTQEEPVKEKEPVEPLVEDEEEEKQKVMTVKGVDLTNITAEALCRLVHRVEDVKVWLRNLPMKYVKTEWKDVYQLAFSL